MDEPEPEAMQLSRSALEAIRQMIGREVDFRDGKTWRSGKCVSFTADMVHGFYAPPLYCVIEFDTGQFMVIPERLVRS